MTPAKLHASALFTALALSGCTWGISDLEYSGPVCGGQTAEIRLQDGKARQGFEMQATCADGTTLAIKSTDSTTEGQARAVEAITGTADVIEAIGGAVARIKPPLWTGPLGEVQGAE